MQKRLRSAMLAVLLAGFLSAPVLAAAPLNQGEVLLRSGQEALLQDEWYLALTLWDDIPLDSQAYSMVKEQFERLRGQLEARGETLEQALSGKAYEMAQEAEDQLHLVAALYFLDKVSANSEYAYQAMTLRQIWRKQLRQQGRSYESELREYSEAYQGALRSWQRDNYHSALRRLRAIGPDSPFYLRARAILRYARTQLADLPADLMSDDPVKQPPEIPASWAPVPRNLAVGLQGRLAWPLGESLGAAGGLGLSWYPIRQLALHLEANAFPILGNLSWFVPVSARYVHSLQPTWDLYAGLGGFWSQAGNASGFGLLGEIGTTWEFTPGLALELGLDYGIPFEAGLNQHTAGARLGIMKTF